MDMMIVGDGGPRKKRDRTSYLAFRHQFRHSPDQGPEERLYGGAWTLYWDSILGTPDLAWKRKPISLIAMYLGGDHRHFVLRADFCWCSW
ncbi:hypothetical protein JMJ77_0014232 [Colletotrichum scovillei]|uniref:Uncharacterized protein n=1 Tax=Colletotrichum scovillei TaxID=1209932 RepID=A0A9P7UH93_9PEZI|nr:hypothetical protein JMJ77_0014232 [Colletotrichum scovillei]KAG7065756.1 hypothetical protein JMJ78_0012504 [Colletotrichum scovillei]KAG7068362.1 hypothetical protein JMJ76_0008052 [Colletotrichum scovillei]